MRKRESDAYSTGYAKGLEVGKERFHDLVAAELASLGGRMLTEHGEDGPHPNETLASVGGYLLTHYGREDGDG